MGAKIRLELVHDGFSEILRSSEVGSYLMAQGESVAAQCGDGYECVQVYGSKDGRVMAYVRPATDDAEFDEAVNKTMEKAVNG